MGAVEPPCAGLGGFEDSPLGRAVWVLSPALSLPPVWERRLRKDRDLQTNPQMALLVRPSFERHVVLWLQTFLQVLSCTRTEARWAALQVWSEWLQVGLLSAAEQTSIL